MELGKSVFLTCRATGRPPPTVTWRRGDGQALEPGRGSRTGQRDSGVLVFESKRRELGGLADRVEEGRSLVPVLAALGTFLSVCHSIMTKVT